MTVLDEEARRKYTIAAGDLAAFGPDKFADLHPDYDDGDDEEGPSPVSLVLAVGLDEATIGWCDAQYEDNPGHINWCITNSCERFGLPVPEFPAPGPDGRDAVLSRLQEADRALATVGLRLLFLDPDADAYYFVPVATAKVNALAGRSGPGFDFHSIDTLP